MTNKKKLSKKYPRYEFPPTFMEMGGGLDPTKPKGTPEATVAPVNPVVNGIDFNSHSQPGFYDNPKLYQIPPDTLIKTIEANESTRNNLDSFVENYNNRLRTYNQYAPTLWRSSWGDDSGRKLTGYTGMNLDPFIQSGSIKRENGGYIAPQQEAMYNTDESAKATKQYMSAAEDVGWSILDSVASPVAISGKSLSGYINPNKRSKVTGSVGSTFGTIESQYLHPIAQEVIGNVIPMAKPITEAAGSIGDTISPMVNQNDPEAVRNRQMTRGIAQSVGGAMGSFGGGKMKRLGGKIYANGGPIDNMGLNQLNGPTHEEGGMSISPDTEVEGGETINEAENYVYSDNIKVPGTKKTFAQASKSIKNKYKLRPNDKLSKESMDSELASLMEQQEVTKAEMFDKQVAKATKMIYGGSIDRNNQPVQMRKGGHIDPITGNPYFPVDYAQPDPNLDVSVMPADKYYNINNIPSLDSEGQTNAVLDTDGYPVLTSQVYQPNSKFRGLPIPDSVEQPAAGPTGQVVSGQAGKPESSKGKFKWPNLRIPNSAVAAAVAGIKGAQKQPLLLTPNMEMNYVNTRPAEVIAQQEGELGIAAGIDAIKNNAMTQGNFIANAANIAANAGVNAGKAVAGIKYQGDVNNVQLANQEAANRQAVSRENNVLRTQYSTAQNLRRDKMLDDFSRIAQSQNVDNVKREQQNNLLTLLSTGVAKANPDGTISIKVTNPDGTFEWVPYTQAMDNSMGI